jgi:hypothetical protein
MGRYDVETNSPILGAKVDGEKIRDSSGDHLLLENASLLRHHTGK